MNSGSLFEAPGRLAHPVQSRLHAISDAGWQYVRPLDDCLVGNAYGLGGCCSGPPKKFDCFGFAHIPLNHSSSVLATIVQCTQSGAPEAFGTLAYMAKQSNDSEALRRKARDAADRKAYGKRLSQAFEGERSFGITIQKLADALDISYQGVKKAMDGDAMPSARNNALLAKELHVDANWLATGEGFARPQVDPDALATEQEKQLMGLFRGLRPEVRDEVVVAVNVTAKDGTVSAKDPYAKAPKPGGSKPRGQSIWGEIDTAGPTPAAKKARGP